MPVYDNHMAFDERVAERLRGLFDTVPVMEKRMFGGVAFMVRGNMCAGVTGSNLMLRVGPQAYEECLRLPHAKPMDFTGKPMKGYLYIEETEKLSDAQAWKADWTDAARSEAAIPFPQTSATTT